MLSSDQKRELAARRKELVEEERLAANRRWKETEICYRQYSPPQIKGFSEKCR